MLFCINFLVLRDRRGLSGKSCRPPRPMLQLTVPGSQLEASYGQDPEYDRWVGLTEFRGPSLGRGAPGDIITDNFYQCWELESTVCRLWLFGCPDFLVTPAHCPGEGKNIEREKKYTHICTTFHFHYDSFKTLVFKVGLCRPALIKLQYTVPVHF